MATHQISILAWPSAPGSGGNVFFELLSVKGTNNVFDRLLLVFNDTATRDGIAGGFTVPQDYVGSAKIIVVWTSTAITNDIELDFDYRAVGGDDAESLDQSGTQETVNINDTAPSAAWERMEASLTLTAGNFAAGDMVNFELFRDGTDAGDTMAAAATVWDVLFEYADA